MKQKTLYLLDAYALIYRAYYALIRQPRIARDGRNTSAVFGFVNTLEELLRSTDAEYMAVCFDPHGPTFRHEKDPSYKAEREEMPEAIRFAIPYIKNIIEAYGIAMVETPGYEADDVIGTLAVKAAADGFTVYMMTPDKDFGQLVSPGIFQYRPATRGNDPEIRGEKEVCELYGLQHTRQVIDLLALMGDKVDNIPGCPGVGEKGAVKLIKEFGSVEEMLQHTDRIKGALRGKIEANADKIRHSKFMATICTDAPVGVNPEQLKRGEPNADHLFVIFQELEFRALADRVAKRLFARNDTAQQSAPTDSLFSEADFDSMPAAKDYSPEPEAPIAAERLRVQWVLADNPDAVEKMRLAAASAKECGIYLSAYGEGDMQAQLRAAAISFASGENFVIPANCSRGVELLLQIMARQDIRKVSRQAKRDYVIAARLRHDAEAALINYYDITLAHYLLQPELSHDLEQLADTRLHQLPVSAPAEPKTALIAAQLASPLTDQEQERCCHEAYLALQLAAPLQSEIKSAGLESLLEEMELPLARVLAEMEITGVRIDTAALSAAATTLQQRADKLEKEIHTLAGEPFKVASPRQVGEVLFQKLQLDPKAKKTKSGQYITNDAVLETIADRHPIVNLIRDFRQLRKLVNTWLEALPKAINPATGRVHTNYNQTVTATGRISSSNPNLQNIPVRDDLGKEIRRAFIADPGCTFLSADYSQIELRLVADFANDPVMLDAFNRGEDIHAITASKIYGVEPTEVTAEQRRHAKTANFGILYGISAFGLAQRLGVSRTDAKTLIDGYNNTFPTVHEYMQQTLEQARIKGYVQTISGRKRMQPDIKSHNAVVRGYAERNAINAPIQGSAADVIKKAMVDIATEMRQRRLHSKMIMQVHDELNFNIAPGEEEVMSELVPRLMEAAYHGSVRLIAECGTGPDWLTAH